MTRVTRAGNNLEAVMMPVMRRKQVQPFAQQRNPTVNRDEQTSHKLPRSEFHGIQRRIDKRSAVLPPTAHSNAPPHPPASDECTPLAPREKIQHVQHDDCTFEPCGRRRQLQFPVCGISRCAVNPTTKSLSRQGRQVTNNKARTKCPSACRVESMLEPHLVGC